MNKQLILLTIILAFTTAIASGQKKNVQKMNGSRIDLSGEWRFQTDPSNKGEEQKWFLKTLHDVIRLPGSMTTNGKGNNVDIHTPWMGSIIDSAYFFKPGYEQYRKPGNIKVPFWLQPVKYYKGAAWYQKTVSIPAEWNNKKRELFIERSHWETTVWIDEKQVGMQNSLGTAQVFDLTKFLQPGLHQLTIRVDNSIKDINVGPNSHSISDHTQTNWNGMIGNLYIAARPSVYIDNVQLFPDIQNRQVAVKVLIRNISGTPVHSTIDLNAVSKNKHATPLNSLKEQITVPADSFLYERVYAMGDKPLLWDEFHPNMYSMHVKFGNAQTKDEISVDFGMRKFIANGTQFTINGRKMFLRGTLECAIFPKTGYPPTDIGSWLRIFNIAKSYGLNHFRFHSWCPPEAAFRAADRSGFYLQIECSSWANWGTLLGDGLPIDRYIYDESENIVRTYGNHPSFCLLTYGNEPEGKGYEKYLNDFVTYWKTKDNRRLYTSASAYPVVPANDYNVTPSPRIQLWDAGLTSIINAGPPRSDYDWREVTSQWKIPTVGHEIGEWCVYPDFKEIKKYTGILKAKNFEIFQSTLRANGLGHLAGSFLLASGKLQVLCYKAEIEAALRTPGFAGFQLLDLHDFPGQGTALVGVLNAFWENKGYITGKEYSQFCNSTVPLVRLPKMIFLNNEQLSVPVEIAHFGEAEITEVVPLWKLTDADGKILFSGKLPKTNIPVGNNFQLGTIQQPLSSITTPSKLTLTVSVNSFQNDWDIFVYPAAVPLTTTSVLLTQQLDENAMGVLNSGGKVLLSLKKGTLKNAYGGNIGIGFSSIFWNTAWTVGQPPHTLGILCDPNHPALSLFPTAYYSNWQWWDAMSHSNAIILDSVSKNLQPIVRVIDDWNTNRSLGLLFECKIGKGKLLVSGIDLITDQPARPEARQLLYSLQNYMSTNAFNPSATVLASKIKALVN